MFKITNLVNSPHDLETLDGPVRLPAMGSIEGEFRFAPEYLAQMKAVGFFDIAEAQGKASKPAEPVAEPEPPEPAQEAPAASDEPEYVGKRKLSELQSIEDLASEGVFPAEDARTDDELRAIILDRTGKKAHHKAGRAKLLAQVVEIEAQPVEEAF